MNAVQVLALLFVLWMTYFSFLHFRRGEFSFLEFSFWEFIWLGLAYVVFFPKSFNFIIEKLHFTRTFDLLTVTAILLLFGASFRNYVIVRRTDKRMEDLVRKLSLKE